MLAFGLAGPAQAASGTPLGYGCALKALGSLRAVSSSSKCTRLETAVTVLPGPTVVCTGPSGAVRWVARQGLCLHGERQLVLPAAGDTYFCADPLLGYLFLSSGPSCPKRYTLYSVAAAAVNHPPAATADAYSTNEDAPLIIPAPGILGNDSDPDGDTLTASLGSGPTHALSFSLNPDGSFAYTPAASYHGPDSFTYTDSDGKGGISAVTTVSLTVNAVNHPPSGQADAYSTGENTQLIVPVPGVLGNDSDPDGDTLTASLGSGPTHSSSFSLNSDGSFSYTPASNYNGPDSFTYTANDGKGGASSIVTVSLTINPPANQPPVAQDDSYSTDENTVLTGNVLSNDSDPDGDSLTVTNPTEASLTYGHLSLQASGDFGFTPYSEVCGATGGTLDSSYVYSISDGHGGTDSATLKVSIHCPATNPPADVTTNDAGFVSSSSATLNGSANPQGSATSGYFRYSTTNPGSCDDSFGTATPSGSLGSGTSDVPFSYSLSGLSASTTYYYCAVATNSNGTRAASNDPVSFTTGSSGGGGGGGGGGCAIIAGAPLGAPGPIDPDVVSC